MSRIGGGDPRINVQALIKRQEDAYYIAQVPKRHKEKFISTIKREAKLTLFGLRSRVVLNVGNMTSIQENLAL